MKISVKLYRILASNQFFWCVITFFILEALWIALSAIYPGAFDEDFHLGIIKIYAEQWTPFFDQAPDGSAALGGVIRDPSYLYHFLMSFPYRLMATVIHDQSAQVIILRLANIGMFAGSLVLFRRFLVRLKLSKPIIHLGLLFLCLLPITPLLAAQINYDNLLVLVIAAIFLQMQTIVQKMAENKLPARRLLILLSTCIMASLVKYAFLPIFMAVVIFFVAYIFKKFHWATTIKTWRVDWRLTSRLGKITIISMVIIGLGLFAQRYIYNMVVYHTPIPDCAKVLDDKACLQYGPWSRDYTLRQNKTTSTENVFGYAPIWTYGMWYRTFFAVNGNTSDATSYSSYPPYPIISYGALALFVAACLALLLRVKHVFYSQPLMICMAMIITFYVGVLFMQNFEAYTRTGQPVAINGRYLLLIAIPLLALFTRAISGVITSLPALNYGLVLVSLFVFSQGGGVITFICRSQDGWYWPNNAVINTNKQTQQIIKPLLYDYKERADWPDSP
jgi:hypothetical protein